MKGIKALFLGIFGTFAFSWLGLIFVPNLQIGHLDPQMDEEGADVYPAPRSGMAERGRRIYIANGCIYCHTQQVRADYAASDIERKWGERRSAPRDYLFDRPATLGRMRMGPDLSNVGKRAPSDDANAPQAANTAASPAGGAGPAPATSANPAGPASAKSPAATVAAVSPAAAAPSPPSAATGSPAAASPAVVKAGAAPSPGTSVAPPAANVAANANTSADTMMGPDGAPIPYTAAWHHRHLYSPRSVNLDSNMPSYAFLYNARKVGGQVAADALQLSGPDAPEQGIEIVPTYDAKCLVAYLMSLDQSHALKEVKSVTPPSPPAPAKGVK